MKILILTFFYPPDLSAGSFRASALVNNLLSLKNRELMVDVIAASPNRYNSFQPEFSRYEESENIRIMRVDVGRDTSGQIGQIVAFIRFAYFVLAKIKSRKYDLVFGTSSRLATAFLTVLVSKLKNTNSYIDIRDLFRETFADTQRVSLVSKFLIGIIKKIEKYTFENATKINIVSPGFYDYVLGISNHKKLSTFTNGIDPLFRNMKVKKHSISGKYKIVYAGNIGASQELHKLLPRVAKLFRDRVEFHIYGDGNCKDLLLKEIELYEAGNIFLHKPTNRHNLIQVYADCDALFLTLANKRAFQKVIPSKLFEYSASPRPILAGLVGYSSDFASENISGCYIYKPDSIESLMQQLEYLLDDRKHYNREDFIIKYDRQRIMSEMTKDILSIVSNSKEAS